MDLQESVDDAYKIDGMSWMMTQQLRAEVRKMKDANGRPIWMPSYDAGIGAPQDELLHYKPTGKCALAGTRRRLWRQCWLIINLLGNVH